MTRPILLQASRVAAATFIAAATGLGLQAQQSAAVLPAASTATSTETYPALNLQATMKAPLNFFEPDSSSSSSPSSDLPDAVTTERFSLGSELQPPPRRRYGRPRYTDNQHNADGSNKYTFVVGGGFTLPVGGTHNYLTPSFNFQGGVGRNFNKNVGVIAQFDYAAFGIQTNTLNTLLATYNSLGAADQSGNALTQLGGSSHDWALTLNPIYNLSTSGKSGAYVVAGFGFYHKTANFTIPAIGQYCDPYYGCYTYQANQTIDKYASNAIGVNGGVGYTYKPSEFSNLKFYAEARYVYTANSQRPYSEGSSTSTYFNVFPQNSAKTTYIPITFGIRF